MYEVHSILYHASDLWYFERFLSVSRAQQNSAADTTCWRPKRTVRLWFKRGYALVDIYTSMCQSEISQQNDGLDSSSSLLPSSYHKTKLCGVKRSTWFSSREVIFFVLRKLSNFKKIGDGIFTIILINRSHDESYTESTLCRSLSLTTTLWSV
jgi:hypothetical protein